MFRVARTVGLVNDPENEEVFRKLGVSVAFSATQIIARILEERAGFEEIASLIPVAEGKVTVSEVALRPDVPGGGSGACKRLSSRRARLIGGIIRDGEVIVPRGDTRLMAGDRSDRHQPARLPRSGAAPADRGRERREPCAHSPLSSGPLPDSARLCRV